MPKPKKSAPTVTEPEPMDAMDTVESEMPSPMPSPEPPDPTQPSFGRGLLEPPQADITEDFDLYDRAPILVRVYRKRMVAAERQFKIIKRRWERKKRTYIDSGKYSPWAEASIVRRTRQRLIDADVELGEAWAVSVQCRDRWVRWRSCAALMLHQDRQVRLHGVSDPTLEPFVERAMRRVCAPCPKPSWKAYFEGLGHNIWDWNAMHFGLGVSHGLMHSDQLQDPSADPNETKGARTCRLKARAEARQQERDEDQEEYSEELGLFPAQSFDAWRQERKGKGAAA